MTRQTGSALPLLLLVCVCVCVSSADDKAPPSVLDAVVIRSTRGRIPASRGSSVKLSCEATYYAQLCGLLHVVWRDEEGAKLTDPEKYLTTVNETLSDGDTRIRQVVTEILHLTPEDSGRYHCIATCGDVESAVGRACEVEVRG